jgi:hypothetical protein
MSKKAKETQLTMDMIMKMSPETFRDIMKAQSLGFKQSLLNLLKANYEQCNLLKDSILVILEKATLSEEERKDNEKALKDLYLCLQLIEDRHTILDILVKETLN